ncbi:hypothetical protein PMAYCL1PPCAC_04092 [Pristionchus mayeri]|uniref:Uncharacterized protein n=1 Tax=Pristionchus mayeri TaxID=1317129 RepID=A0AAN4Z9Q0_9BILA|nr:hypothetical protein PMAYCL1PPCAC_04092 [Pristionchus mayeri]
MLQAALLFFLLLPPLSRAQFLLDPLVNTSPQSPQIREIFGVDAPPSPVFRNPDLFVDSSPPVAQNPAETITGDDVIRFAPMASIKITPSEAKDELPSKVEEATDMAPHEWSQMTVFVKTDKDGKTLNDQFANVLSRWIRTTKGLMHGKHFATTTTTSSPVEMPPTSTITVPLPPSFDATLPAVSQLILPPTPPPTEFVNKEDLFTTKPPKTEVFDRRMPTIVEEFPQQAEVIDHNPLIEEEDLDQYAPPQTFQEMLKICPMYPETATMFVHQVVKRDYSAGFETRVQCRCGDGSHESFFARKSKPLITDQGPSLDPAFQRSDLIVGRFSCAFPGIICVRTENNIQLRSMDWQTAVYPAVGSGAGWANSYILLMENGTKLEDADSGKVYLGASQFEGERRKSRREHSYLRIKSISCDGCLRSLTCQR